MRLSAAAQDSCVVVVVVGCSDGGRRAVVPDVRPAARSAAATQRPRVGLTRGLALARAVGRAQLTSRSTVCWSARVVPPGPLSDTMTVIVALPTKLAFGL